MSKLILVFTLIILNSSFSLSQENFLNRIKLNKVIIEFEESIKQKDSIRFKQLFFEGPVPFVGVMSKETEMSIKKDYPEFEGIAVSNSTKFIKDICKAEKPQVEKFYNIDIASDGVIATISFDYAFYSGTRMIQWGNEKWNLVNVDNTWLITEVIYSIRFPEVETFPYDKTIEKKE